MRIGYARVSTREQTPESQRQLLEAAGCEVIFIDHGISGKKANRPELDKMKAKLRKGDTVVITRLSRLFRSLKDLIATVDEWRAMGVDLEVTQQPINTTTAEGRLMFQIVGAFDEFQREIIATNTREGLAATEKRGRKGGRPHKLGLREIREVYRMVDEHDENGRKVWNISAIARHFNVSRPTIHKLVNDRESITADFNGGIEAKG